MRFPRSVAIIALLSGCSLGGALPEARAQVVIGVTVTVAPPLLPVYVQPPIPEPGYLWEPGYWAWDGVDGYYWVPGTWVRPPQPELLWTPGYWGWNNEVYVFHSGYWGKEVGFYGGVPYGFGYTGGGYEGGYWNHGNFLYNSSVNNVKSISVTNLYSKTVVVNNTTNVSYNGGNGGIVAQPTPQQVAVAQLPHIAPTPAQTQHAVEAKKDPAFRFSANHGIPAVAATPRPGVFKGPGIVAPSSQPFVPQVKPVPASPAAKAPINGPATPAAGANTPGQGSTANGGKGLIRPSIPAGQIAAPTPVGSKPTASQQPMLKQQKAQAVQQAKTQQAAQEHQQQLLLQQKTQQAKTQQAAQQQQQLLQQQKAQQAAQQAKTQQAAQQHQQQLMQQQRAQQAAQQAKTQQAAQQHQQQLLQQQRAQQAAQQQQRAQQAAQQQARAQQATQQHQQQLLQQERAQQASQQRARVQQAAPPQRSRECGKPGLPPCR